MLHTFECINRAWKFDKKSEKVWWKRPINIFTDYSSLYWEVISMLILEIDKETIRKSQLLMFFIERYSTIIPRSNNSRSATFFTKDKREIRSRSNWLRDIIIPTKNKNNEILVLWYVQVEFRITFASVKYQRYSL